jgi:hypothetical protein
MIVSNLASKTIIPPRGSLLSKVPNSPLDPARGSPGRGSNSRLVHVKRLLRRGELYRKEIRTKLKQKGNTYDQ